MSSVKNERMGPPELEPEIVARRRLFGLILLPVMVLITMALISYDWRDIDRLYVSGSHIPNNFIGPVGAHVTFLGYSVMGLAYWFVPVVLLGWSIFLLYGRGERLVKRIFWTLLVMVFLACIFQIYSEGCTFALTQLNLRPNAGGALGQWLVTDLTKRWMATMGAVLIFWPAFLIALVLLFGLRNTAKVFARLAAMRLPRPAEPVEEGSIEAALKDRERRLRNEPRDDDPPPRDGLIAGFRKRRAEKRAEAEAIKAAQNALEEEQSKKDAMMAALQQRERPEEDSVREALRKKLAQEQPAPETAVDEDLPLPPPLPRTSSKLQPVSTPASVTAPAPLRKKDAAEDAEPVGFEKYKLPSTKLLHEVPRDASDAGNTQEASESIVSVLNQFNIDVTVEDVVSGPVVTQYEVKPAMGVKVERIAALSANLKMALFAASMRIQAPIPGKNVVGIEVPNRVASPVVLRELLESRTWKDAVKRMRIPLALGKNANGGDLVVDLADMPHMLVAGSTGSGKSVCLNAILVGILMSRTPEQVRIILVDPKQVEFTSYEGLPHLLVPVVKEPRKVLFALRWAVVEMDKRYNLFRQYGVRKIDDYNALVDKPQQESFLNDPNAKPVPPAKLPFVVFIIDELADLMIQVKAEIEPSITRITQLARAAGIHMIIATQRPVVDVITGTIKSNIPGRIAFKVAQGNDSRTILDEKGAEDLIGKGDMLFVQSGKGTIRSQGAWVADDEINAVTRFIKDQVGAAYDTTFANQMERIRPQEQEDPLEAELQKIAPEATPTPEPSQEDVQDTSDEGYYKRALELIQQTGRFSVSALQRRAAIGYNKAGRIADMLEARGIIGPNRSGSATREILVDLNSPQFAQSSTSSPAPNATAPEAFVDASATHDEASQEISTSTDELDEVLPDGFDPADVLPPDAE